MNLLVVSGLSLAAGLLLMAMQKNASAAEKPTILGVSQPWEKDGVIYTLMEWSNGFIDVIGHRDGLAGTVRYKNRNDLTMVGHSGDEALCIVVRDYIAQRGKLEFEE